MKPPSLPKEETMDTNTTDQNTKLAPTTTAEDASSTANEPDYKALARPLGWRDEEHFKGDPSRFVDAKSYYENSRHVLPIIKAENESLRAEIVRVKNSTTEVLAHMERAREREVAELNAALTAAKATRKAAIKEGDGDGFEIAEDDIKRIEKELDTASTPPASTTQTPTKYQDPVFAAWVADNPWYEQEPGMRAMAESLAYAPQFTHLKGQHRALYDAVGSEVKRIDALMKAQADGDTRRPGPQGGGRGNDGVSRTGAARRSYDNLLPEFKAACDRQYRDFGIKTEVGKWRDRYITGCNDDAFRS